MHVAQSTSERVHICMSLGYENTPLVNRVPDPCCCRMERKEDLEQFSKTKRLKPSVNKPTLHIEPASQVLICVLTALNETQHPRKAALVKR